MTTIINAVSGTGITQTADGSGVMKLQSNGVTTNALAWANFSCPSSTVTVNGSYNISSITRSAAGSYVVNFTTATSNANYAALANCSSPGSIAQGPAVVIYATAYSTAATAPTVNSFVFSTFGTNSGVGQDCTYFTIAVFGQ
jgi:hypothetical protein